MGKIVRGIGKKSYLCTRIFNQIRFAMATAQEVNRQRVADGIENILREAAPRRGRAILFGSRARGDARSDSDWDVLILLDKDRITTADMDEISYPIRSFGWQIDEMINPIMYTTKEWEAKSFTPFYKNVMKEGVVL